MTTAIKRRRGTTTQHSTFTGLEGEITIDTTKDTAVVHDGATAGGRPLLREDLANNTEVVTKTGTQTLTNKTFTSPVINTPTGITKSDISLGNVDNTSDATKNAATATLTNKTITLGANTITGTVAQFQAAVTDGDFATLAGTETLTNKAFNGSLGATTPSTIAGTTITSSALTSGRVTFASTGGLLADSANLTFDGTTLSTVDLTTTGNTILGNASTDTLNVGNGGLVKDASGNVGIGTATAPKRLTIKDNSSASTTVGTNPIVWIAGGNSNVNTLSEIGFSYGGSTSDTNVPATIGYQLTSGSGYTNGALTFATRNVTTDTAPTERMRIDSSGNLLVGTTSGMVSAAKLVVNGSGLTSACVFKGDNTPTPAGAYVWNATTTGNGVFFEFGTEAAFTTRGTISYNRAGGVVLYNTTSDYRLKNNQQPLTGSGAFIDALKPKTWEWATDGSKGVGFIAHEFAEISPSSVSGEKDDTEVQEYEVSPAIPAVLDAEGVEVTPAIDAVMGERTVPKYQGMQASSAEVMANLVAEIQDLRKRLAILEAK